MRKQAIHIFHTVMRGCFSTNSHDFTDLIILMRLKYHPMAWDRWNYSHEKTTIHIFQRVWWLMKFLKYGFQPFHETNIWKKKVRLMVDEKHDTNLWKKKYICTWNTGLCKSRYGKNYFTSSDPHHGKPQWRSWRDIIEISDQHTVTAVVQVLFCTTKANRW